MKLSEENQRKVEENLGLVHKVINDKVHGPYQLGIYTCLLYTSDAADE
mgnify:CR=1 FL=1